MQWLTKFLGKRSKSSGRPSRAVRRTRLQLEALEERQVPTVTYHGGALLPHVEVNALYYGQNWGSNPTLYNVTGQVEGYLNYIVNSPYVDMLTNAGYGVGRGSFHSGWITYVNPNPAYFLTDSTIRSSIQANIDAGNLQAPDANRLYVVYVEPNVAVQNDHDGNSNSIRDFLGYHGAFAGHTSSGAFADVHYAVITYPGGTANNAAISSLTAFQQLTEVTSHELSEAVTDPNVNYRALGWYDDQRNGEIGDIVNGQYVYLNGYVVQKEAAQNDGALVPAGAQDPSNYYTTTTLTTSVGRIVYHQSVTLTATVSSNGNNSVPSGYVAFLDGSTVLGYGTLQTVNGVTTATFTTSALSIGTHSLRAYYYGNGTLYGGYSNTVSEAVVNPAHSFVLTQSGVLYEYGAVDGWRVINTGVTSISNQGTDRYGYAKVDVQFSNGYDYEYHDWGSWTYLAYGARSLEAGNGYSYVLFPNGVVNLYSEYSGAQTYLTSGAMAISAGTDRYGYSTVDVLFGGGTAWEYSTLTGWRSLASNVASISAGHGGVHAVVFNGGNLYEMQDATNSSTYLLSGVTSANAGTDQNGNATFTVTYYGVYGYTWTASAGFSYVGYGVTMDKANAGTIDVLYSNGNLYYWDTYGDNYYLTSGVRQAS
jgi:hypothetical protein